ncbi:alpha/beta-hydrolase [Eremomyces bilateralis CBS 781.70]|uniref:Carboxylic ester hydrolase n=1 Tax=Eremomyces bilateralis CBS 781.70 TaxID=1392243 RepID=A0A6G1G912_9PEZI|nr:alpha/beta-hydrolase [Eremomyces bilateralis CBS 781.70]KAF1814568.1 alpha/beta-hydrolase [Eremomyces bilateralis CBS 781.70]
MRVTLAAVLLSVLVGESQAGWKVGEPVLTTSGLAVGRASSKRSGVSEYLGIPFALPPTGEQRWAPPKQLNSSDGKVINATKYGPSCAESASLPYRLNPSSPPPANIGAAENEQDEDCLYLNIWTKPQTGEKKKAVMIWIYGGAFLVGSAANAVYNGASLADDEDVVLVSLNYRLGVLGFPGVNIPEKNLGLLDQRAGVEWIRDNIGQFGGDPNRMILFGQSAGGASVDFFSYAWTEDPIISGFIPQSGSASIIRTDITTNNSLSLWSDLSKTLGCGAVTSEATIANALPCMRAAPAEAVLNATAPNSSGSTIGTWGPMIDGKTVFADLEARSADGRFVKAPMLVGNTNNEGATSGTVVGSLQARLSNCASAEAAQIRRDADVPAWRYVYSGEFPNQIIGQNITGAWHGAEIALIFGNTGVRGPDTEIEKKLIKKIQSAWSGFAKDPKHGLSQLGWPLYNAQGETVVVIGGKDSDEITFESPSVTDGNACNTPPSV